MINWLSILLIAIILVLVVFYFILLSKFRKNQKVLLERQRKLEKKSHRLERHNKELDEFAYIVSHDLKAPLRAMSTLSTFVEQDLKKGDLVKVNENLALIRNRTSRMSELIDGILEYAKTTNVIGEIEEVNVDELVKEITSLYKNDKVLFNIDLNLPVINSSKIVMYQIFQNLISNAVVHNNNEHLVVNVNYKFKRNIHQFSIVDNGAGIDEVYLSKIFEMFQTLKPRDEFESTGIGLSIVKKVIDGMGGEIAVTSEKGKGTTFIVKLPALA